MSNETLSKLKAIRELFTVIEEEELNMEVLKTLSGSWWSEFKRIKEDVELTIEQEERNDYKMF